MNMIISDDRPVMDRSEINSTRIHQGLIEQVLPIRLIEPDLVVLDNAAHGSLFYLVIMKACINGSISKIADPVTGNEEVLAIASNACAVP